MAGANTHELERRLAEAADDASPPEAWLALAQARAEMELACVASMLSEPAQGLALFEEAGFTDGWLEQEDLRLIYLAVAFVVRRPTCPPDKIGAKEKVLGFARHGLQLCGLWDPSVPAASRWMVWSDAALVDLACSYPSPVTLPVLCWRLRDRVARAKDAESHLLKLRLLLGDARPVSPLRIAGELVRVARLTGIATDVVSDAFERRARVARAAGGAAA